MTSIYFTPAEISNQAGFIQIPLSTLKAHGRAALGVAAVMAGNGRRWTTEQAAKAVGTSRKRLKLYRRCLVADGYLKRIPGGTYEPASYAEGSKKWMADPYIRLYRSTFELSWSEQIVFAYIRYRCRKLQYGWRSDSKELAEAVGLGQRSVQRALLSLRGRELILPRGTGDKTTQPRDKTTHTPRQNDPTSITRQKENLTVPFHSKTIDQDHAVVSGLSMERNTNILETDPSSPSSGRPMTSSASSQDLRTQIVGHISTVELDHPARLYDRLRNLTIRKTGTKIELPSFPVFRKECRRCLDEGNIKPEALLASRIRAMWWLPENGGQGDWGGDCDPLSHDLARQMTPEEWKQYREELDDTIAASYSRS